MLTKGKPNSTVQTASSRYTATLSLLGRLSADKSLTGADLRAAMQLAAYGPMCPTQIVAALGTSRSQVSRSLRALVSHGYAALQPDPTDPRHWYILTQSDQVPGQMDMRDL